MRFTVTMDVGGPSSVIFSTRYYLSCTVTSEIGFSSKIIVLKLTGNTNPIMASGILNPALAYLPCSKALHVKCRLLPENLIVSPNIETSFSTNSLLLTLLCTAMEDACIVNFSTCEMCNA
jgi:hypothetical protein